MCQIFDLFQGGNRSPKSEPACSKRQNVSYPMQFEGMRTLSHCVSELDQKNIKVRLKSLFARLLLVLTFLTKGSTCVTMLSDACRAPRRCCHRTWQMS